MQIVYMNGRGAIVSDPVRFFKKYRQAGKGRKLALLTLNLAYNVEVYRFGCTFKGASAREWAWMWLKGSESARDAGEYVPSPSLRKESCVSSRACKREFSKEVAWKNTIRKRKGPKALPVGSWFLVDEKDSPDWRVLK